VGLRPLRTAQLRAVRGGGGGRHRSGTRRTRIDGDSWQGRDVPLGEERERYLLRVMEDQTILREVELTLPSWHYSDAMQAQDGVAPSFTVAVAQLSDQFGAGPFRRILINV